MISHSGVRARLPDEHPGRGDSDGLITEEIRLDDGVQVVTQLGLIVAA